MDQLSDGTAVSGFVTGSENPPPRECGSCRWMAAGLCSHPQVMADSELDERKQVDGTIKVDADDCCNNFQSTKEISYDEKVARWLRQL